MHVDYFKINDLLSSDQKLLIASVQDFVLKEVHPHIDRFAQAHQPIPELIKNLGELGVLGPFIPSEYGGAGLDYLSYGLIMQELEAGDSAVRSAASVQSSLVMFPIFEFGSDEQKKKYLPGLASGDLVGAFGLTEPDHGSDPSSMGTRLTTTKGGYYLNGSKSWITNGGSCDVAIVWARDELGKVRGVLLDKGMEGFDQKEITNKWSLRASETGQLFFDQVFIAEDQLLPKVSSMKGPLSCLNSARFGIAWGAIGAAIDCYETALKYALERKQFGKPIASYQLQQKKFAEMLTEITKAQLLAYRLAELKDRGIATPMQISMAKRNNVKMALDVARESRQILGAIGIMGEFSIMRHMMNLESVITYEGTHDIHLLITGQDITGFNAF
ncbi:MAG TPA: acyl-CoA dehydrogenase family protein [Candidatus Sphingobacterium stercoripullorum]|nr:acyl-CoA dehydrogenase family protein [Candidatus Sphingobacterium stercoripullorum]